MNEAYLLKRVIEELDLAERAGSERERTVRLRACRHYSEMLQMIRSDDSPSNGKS